MRDPRKDPAREGQLFSRTKRPLRERGGKGKRHKLLRGDRPLLCAQRVRAWIFRQPAFLLGSLWKSEWQPLGVWRCGGGERLGNNALCKSLSPAWDKTWRIRL